MGSKSPLWRKNKHSGQQAPSNYLKRSWKKTINQGWFLFSIRISSAISPSKNSSPPIKAMASKQLLSWQQFKIPVDLALLSQMRNRRLKGLWRNPNNLSVIRSMLASTFWIHLWSIWSLKDFVWLRRKFFRSSLKKDNSMLCHSKMTFGLT